MKPKAPPTPKFRVQAKKIRDGVADELPHRIEYAFKNIERDAKLKALATECPSDFIEVVLMKGFKDDKPLRWSYSCADNTLTPTNKFDKAATKR